MKTMQQIYDFCLLDNTYNEYYNIPDLYNQQTSRKFKYYHKSINGRGVSRAGNYIYGQSRRQLHRFLDIKDFQAECIRFHIDSKTFEEVDYQKIENIWETIYITTSIERKGVRICFSHPFKRREEMYYYSRSHFPYTKEGVLLDVLRYINKHILFPPGRYCELQMQYEISKEKFVSWYTDKYKVMQQRIDESEYWSMIEKYKKKDTIDYDESYSLLLMSGIFSDFNCDELERDEMTCEFMRVCNS